MTQGIATQAKPLDILDMLTEAQTALEKARAAMPDERIAHPCDLADWSGIARDTAMAAAGASA
jgi:hypothetical protein